MIRPVSAPDLITEVPPKRVPQSHEDRWIEQAERAWHDAQKWGYVRPRLGDFKHVAAYVHKLAAMNHGVCWPTDHAIAVELGLKGREVDPKAPGAGDARSTPQRSLRILKRAGMLERLTGLVGYWTGTAHGANLPDDRYRVMALTGWSPLVACNKAEAEAIKRMREAKETQRVVYDAFVPFPRVALVRVRVTDQTSPQKGRGGQPAGFSDRPLPPTQNKNSEPDKNTGMVLGEWKRFPVPDCVTEEQWARVLTGTGTSADEIAVRTIFGYRVDVKKLLVGALDASVSDHPARLVSLAHRDAARVRLGLLEPSPVAT